MPYFWIVCAITDKMNCVCNHSQKTHRRERVVLGNRGYITICSSSGAGQQDSSLAILRTSSSHLEVSNGGSNLPLVFSMSCVLWQQHAKTCTITLMLHVGILLQATQCSVFKNNALFSLTNVVWCRAVRLQLLSSRTSRQLLFRSSSRTHLSCFPSPSGIAVSAGPQGFKLPTQFALSGLLVYAVLDLAGSGTWEAPLVALANLICHIDSGFCQGGLWFCCYYSVADF